MEDLFSALYPFLFLLALSGFGPQIYKLLTNKASAEAMSFSTWVLWSSSWVISLGYGITKLHDTMFCIMAAVNLFANLTVLAILTYRWCERRGFAFNFMQQSVAVPIAARRSYD